MKSIIFGLLTLAFAGILLTSPYWLFREITRPDDEQLPYWMGDVRTRKKKLAIIAGVFMIVFAGVLIAAGLSE